MRRRAKLKQDVESSRGSFCERKRGEKRETAIRSDVLRHQLFSEVIVCEHEQVNTKLNKVKNCLRKAGMQELRSVVTQQMVLSLAC